MRRNRYIRDNELKAMFTRLPTNRNQDRRRQEIPPAIDDDHTEHNSNTEMMTSDSVNLMLQNVYSPGTICTDPKL